jgi:hypothetical protein
MAFQVSPGVLVTEKDLTTIVPAVSTTDGAFAGVATWGPINEVVLVGDENQLVKRFGKPNNETATAFFTCANFLAYGDKLRIVRIAGDDARNATADGTGILIKNDDDYDANHANGESAVGIVAAKHAGVLGNSIKVSVCPSSEAFSKTLTGTVSGGVGDTTLLGVGTAFTTELEVGSVLIHSGTKQERVVTSIVDDEEIVVNSGLDTALAGATLTAKWEFADAIGIAPSTSTQVSEAGGSKDELHVVVVDVDGKISGTRGTILERHAFMSKASDAKKEDGSTANYKHILNKNSDYIRWMDHPTASNWGGNIATAFDADSAPTTITLAGGVDSNDVSTDATVLGNRLSGYDLFANAELVDVSLVLLGEATQTEVTYVINNICESRMDCVAFASPPKDAVVDNSGNEVADSIAFRNLLPSSSYAVLDSGWKYQYDKYNDIFRWLPLNGDVAGLCVRTDTTNDAWWSPAGYNRGNVKNVIKLAYNPFKAERDDLYLSGINPVMSTQGQGTVLFGDKTLLAKPSAFDRINVRRLFIVLEKAIATASKFMLFEFNDEFTRQQFRNLVEPFLRDVQARRGIYDFKVVCDRTNNTGEVIDRNEFVGDIYIKPARAINFIQLNFVAVRTGVDFSEIVGKA